jgi:hypothetical protein
MNRAFARYLAWRSQGDNTLRGREIKHLLENGYDWKDAAKTSLIPKK